MQETNSYSNRICKHVPRLAKCTNVFRDYTENHNNSADYMSCIPCYHNFPFHFMTPCIVLSKHTLRQEVNCQQDNCHIEIYSHNGFRHVYQESSYLQKNVSIGKQKKIHLLVTNMKIMVTSLYFCDLGFLPLSSSTRQWKMKTLLHKHKNCKIF
jgi:hypothetical protein